MVPVLIIGAGPTGLTLAILLARAGIEAIVVEKNSGTCDHPQAHVVNTRSMEIFRSLGLDALIVEKALPAEASKIRWVESLAGDELACLDLAADEKRLLQRIAASPTHLASCAQDEVEPVLAAKLEEFGGRIHFATEMLSFRQAGDHVVAVIRDGAGTREISARWMVGCDGAGSRTRKSLGIEMEGPGVLGHLVNIYFHADLDRWVRERPAVLYWAVDRGESGLLISMDGRMRWSLHVGFAGDKKSVEEFTAPVCLEHIRRAIGAEVDIDFRAAKPWTMTAEVAASYRVGRVLLAGDAAHRFPPTGGFGMNTGVQDADNLAWKLAEVLRGAADEPLVDTYQAERRPVAQANCDWSVSNIIGVIDIIGPGAAYLSTKLESGELSRAEVSEFIQETADREIGHFDALGLDLGFAYESGALVPDGTPPVVAEDPYRDCVQNARPGSRAPHMWILLDGKRISTLDLFPGRFTLLACDARWRASAQSLDDLEVVIVGEDVIEAEAQGEFLSLYGIEQSGAVLVRPDGHVGWRTAALPDTSPGPATVLAEALAQIRCRP